MNGAVGPDSEGEISQAFIIVRVVKRIGRLEGKMGLTGF